MTLKHAALSYKLKQSMHRSGAADPTTGPSERQDPGLPGPWLCLQVLEGEPDTRGAQSGPLTGPSSPRAAGPGQGAAGLSLHRVLLLACHGTPVPRAGRCLCPPPPHSLTQSLAPASYFNTFGCATGTIQLSMRRNRGPERNRLAGGPQQAGSRGSRASS